MPMQRDRRAVTGTVETRFRSPSLRFAHLAAPLPKALGSAWYGRLPLAGSKHESPSREAFLGASVPRTTGGSGWLNGFLSYQPWFDRRAD